MLAVHLYMIGKSQLNKDQLQGRKRERVSGWDEVKDSEGKSSVSTSKIYYFEDQ